MNSNDLITNLKYYSKFLAIIVIIFLLLKLVINLKLYEALLLSLIITVSILIIENIVQINDIASDPLNCSQCKISTVEIDEDINNNIMNNIVPNLFAESEQQANTNNNNSEVMEPFISDTIEKIIDNVSNAIKKDSIQLNQIVNESIKDDDIYELKCIKTNKQNNLTEHEYILNKTNQTNETNQTNQINQTNQTNELNELKKSIEQLKRDNDMLKSNQQSQQNMIEGFGNTDELENFIIEQKNQNQNLTNKLKSYPNIQANINKIKNTIINQNKQNQQNQQTPNKIDQNEESLESPYLDGACLLNKSKDISELSDKQELNPNTEYNLDSPITYDAGYVQYQQDGLQKQENDASFNTTLFRMGVGQQNVVKPFMRDGSDYYRRIKSYSSKSPTPQEALGSELKYGDYNYIAPLNSGMTNSDYTFVSPNNWYPIPPHPPVCVTNKQCVTSPIIISDGQDWMNWATLEDFDKSRRFTGNMGINIDYVKNVLNNDEGY